MPLLPSASDAEPVLILTDQDFQRAFAPNPEPAPAPAAPPPPPPAPSTRARSKIVPNAKPRAEAPKVKPIPKAEPATRRNWGLVAAAAFVILGGAGSVLWWSTRPRAPEPPAVAPVAVQKPVPKPEPPPEPPPIAVVRRPTPKATPFPVAEEPEEGEAPPAVARPAAPAPSRGAWHGGRAWIRVSLIMENQGKVQEIRQRAVIFWDDSQYVVKPTPPGRAELWMNRLQILLNMPWEGESSHRSIASTSKETLKGEAGVFDCDRVEGEDVFPEQKRAFTYWVSPEFPPGPLQAKVSFKDLSVELRVLGFGPEPGGE